MKIKMKYIIDENCQVYFKATDVINFIKFVKSACKEHEQIKKGDVLNYLENKFYEFMIDSLNKE